MECIGSDLCQVLVRERHGSDGTGPRNLQVLYKSSYFLKPNLANLTVCSMVFFLLITCNDIMTKTISIVFFLRFFAVLVDFFHFAFFVSKPASMQGDSMFSVEDVFSQFDVQYGLMPLDVGRNETEKKQEDLGQNFKIWQVLSSRKM